MRSNSVFVNSILAWMRAFNAGTWEAKAGETLSSTPAYVESYRIASATQQNPVLKKR